MIETTDKYGNPLSEAEINRQIREERRAHRLLVIRNWINIAFILLSVIAIIGVLVYEPEDTMTLFGKEGEAKAVTIRPIIFVYGIAVLAIFIKLVDTVLRLPGFGRKL